MTPCIGWDGPCPVYGQFHGCNVDADTHNGKHHLCDCGATLNYRGVHNGRFTKDPTIGHGTYAMYRRHIRAGETPCVECRRANAERVARQKAS